MKILLDENTPHKLRLIIDAQHTVLTTRFAGWSGRKNGALLTAAEAEGFEVFITGDKGIKYQQNFAGRKIAILVLSTTDWLVLKQRAAEVNAALADKTPGFVAFLDVGRGGR
jgi:hypothetical protein